MELEQIILFALYLPLSAWTSLHILLVKRQPRSAFIWLLLLWFVPWFGLAAYWTFGVNRARRRPAPHPGDRRWRGKVTGPLASLARLGDQLVGHALLRGNRATVLVNGDQAYPEMLAAIASANRSIGLTTYIFELDEVGENFTNALVEAARRGVQVRVLADGLGAWGLEWKLKRRLRNAGAEIENFWPRSRGFFSRPMINLRNHRKVLVVDGRLGFTGGLNISKRHSRGAVHAVRRLARRARGREEPRVRDLHFRLEGPVVHDLAAVFAADWQCASGEALEGRDWFPRLKPAGRLVARGISSGPDQDLEKNYELLLGALRSARKSIDLVTPYYVPDAGVEAALRAAALSGVRVRLLLPRRSDRRLMDWVARAGYWPLVSAGVEIYETRPPFIHAKLALVDSSWCSIGSTNLDPRSFRLNYEFNVELYGGGLAADLHKRIAQWLRGAHRVREKDLRGIGMAARLRNGLVRLLGPFL